MSKENRKRDPLPEQFASYEEAAAFWDDHDTTDYLDVFTDVEVETELRERHFELELDREVVEALRLQARELGTSVSHLVNDLLREQILSSG